MLSPIDQMDTTPQIPLALLHQRPDWLRAELDGLQVLAPESTAAANPLSQVPLLFLRRLAADDRLRAQLKADPAATLARHGVHVAPEMIPAVVSLPGPEALQGVLRLYATEEDKAIHVRWMGFLGGLDDLLGSGDG